MRVACPPPLQAGDVVTGRSTIVGSGHGTLWCYPHHEHNTPVVLTQWPMVVILPPQPAAKPPFTCSFTGIFHPVAAETIASGQVAVHTLDDVRALSEGELKRRPASAHGSPAPDPELEDSWVSRAFAATEVHGDAWRVNATQGSLLPDGGLRYTLHVSYVTAALHAWASSLTEGDVVVSPALQLAR